MRDHGDARPRRSHRPVVMNRAAQQGLDLVVVAAALALVAIMSTGHLKDVAEALTAVAGTAGMAMIAWVLVLG